MQQQLTKCRQDFKLLRPDVEKELKEKDNKIYELQTNIRQLKLSLKKTLTSSSRDENIADSAALQREHDVLKKQFEQLMTRERNARDELRLLKEQMIRRY